jgi:hypothetical protein
LTILKLEQFPPEIATPANKYWKLAVGGWIAMAWSDVVARLKFWGLPVTLPDGTLDGGGPDGEPAQVNGVAATGIAFSKDQKQEILGALQGRDNVSRHRLRASSHLRNVL